MTNIEIIEKQISSLPPEELVQLRRWFAEFDAALWDREIEADVASGKLNALAEKGLRAHIRPVHRPVRHQASPEFREGYHAFLPTVQCLADKNFAILKEDSRHPSLHLKQVGRFRSVRIGLHHRALGVSLPDGILWLWIGSHAEYDLLLGRQK